MKTFTILAEPTRRAIVEMLARRGELGATVIGQGFDSSLAAISQHLKALREADILSLEKRGRERIYSLNTQALDEINEWARQTKELWEARLDRLGERLALDRPLNARAKKPKAHK